LFHADATGVTPARPAAAAKKVGVFPGKALNSCFELFPVSLHDRSQPYQKFFCFMRVLLPMDITAGRANQVDVEQKGLPK
jgi:hypothetical protein